MSTKQPWSELCIHHGEGEQDELLVKGIQPFLDGLPGRDDLQAFFLRERAGKQPFLRVRMRGAESEQILARLRAHLAASLPALLPGSPMPEKERFHACEYELPRLAPGGAVGLEIMEDFLADTSRLALRVVASTMDHRQRRIAAAFDTMVVHAHVTSKSLPSLFGSFDFPATFFSYRSHADGFIIWSNDSQAAKKRFDDGYQKNAELLRSRLRHLMAILKNSGRTDDVELDTWSEVTARYLGRVQAAARDGQLRLGDENLSGWLGDKNDISVSGFHQVLQSSKEFQKRLRSDTDFISMRVLFSYLYWHLSLIGLELIDRFFLCNAVARAFEDVFGIDPANPPSLATGPVDEDGRDHVRLP